MSDVREAARRAKTAAAALAPLSRVTDDAPRASVPRMPQRMLTRIAPLSVGVLVAGGAVALHQLPKAPADQAATASTIAAPAPPSSPALGMADIPLDSPELRLPGMPVAQVTSVVVLSQLETAAGRMQAIGAAREDGTACIGERVGVGRIDAPRCLDVASIIPLSIVTGSTAGDPVSIVEGFSPVGASRVELSAPGEAPVSVPAYDSGAVFHHHTYYLAAWPHPGSATVTAYDAAGHQLATGATGKRLT